MGAKLHKSFCTKKYLLFHCVSLSCQILSQPLKHIIKYVDFSDI